MLENNTPEVARPTGTAGRAENLPLHHRCAANPTDRRAAEPMPLAVFRSCDSLDEHCWTGWKSRAAWGDRQRRADPSWLGQHSSPHALVNGILYRGDTVGEASATAQNYLPLPGRLEGPNGA